MSSEELRLFDKVRVFLDENVSSAENFTVSYYACEIWIYTNNYLYLEDYNNKNKILLSLKIS